MFLVGSDVAETCGDSFLKGDFLSSGKKQNKMRRCLGDDEHINLGRQAGGLAGGPVGRKGVGTVVLQLSKPNNKIEV